MLRCVSAFGQENGFTQALLEPEVSKAIFDRMQNDRRNVHDL
jgi:hypothetical protein